ncbi:SbcC/MukB-like Walker B domain-containing protein [Cryobacterium sp. PH29-G1]|uniref:ATP-binding protein n=1 Tax=Cryobacterium sp. PH29-G1 TaxID=3046211 RepID=UPI0024BA599D|nr:SbcC/MukB-like Walker B domain-containing protein [Cryobacterium sp. PH29-G1]MDJ0349537.1 ATP-binding protein [Cryobacterium sp. PH29-G1]
MTMLEMPGLDETTDSDNANGPIHVGQWRLARVELLNWGTFDGHHPIDVARKGHLFTGASGSGKSSLLDAIGTVLTPDKWLRFNAAAQESAARNDDRSLVSYVRGAWSKEADENLDRAVSTYLRKTATWSGILLRFENGRDAPVTLARLFHLRGSSVDKADLKDVCFVDRANVGLLDFREFVASGIEARRIKGAWPDAVVTTTGSHNAFYVKLRRLLGINSQNALHLLHKTQSAKNLGSLDQLFRSFMLDEPATFARAKNAVEQFGELSQAHQHVVELRRQAEHLTRLETSIAAYESAATAAAEAERLGDLIDPFQNQLTLRLAGDERSVLRSQQARAAEDARRADAALDDSRLLLAATARRALQLGGSDAAQMQELLKEAHKAADATGLRYLRFSEELAGAGVAGVPQNGEEFTELQESSRRALQESAPTAALDHQDNQQYFTTGKELDGIDRELNELRTRKSNLPAALLLARKRLAEELGVPEVALPFAGELIEVLPEFAEWSGAIERVLFPLASALLVRDSFLPEVRRRVEARNLGARLVFEAVPALADPPRAARSTRSLLHRIRVSDGAFHDFLQARTAKEFDYACVDHPDELDRVEKGVTVGGQVKKSARRYEKNDRYAITERSHWILGADNEAKIDLLLERRRDSERRNKEAGERLQQAQVERDAATRRRSVLERVLSQAWSEIDGRSADDLVRTRRRQLDVLSTGNAELHDAITAETEARERFTAAEKLARDHEVVSRLIEAQLAEVDALVTALESAVDAREVTEADATDLEARYRKIQRKLDRKSIGDVGRKVSETLNGEARVAQRLLNDSVATFTEGAVAFKARWVAAAGDLTTSIDDRAGYRVLLSGIVARGLPEHEANFLKLLRDKSRDLIGHLASDIRDAPKLVVDRIEPVNASLGRSRFDVERYLRIEVKTRRAPEVLQFMADLKTVVDGAWSDDGLAAAEARFAVLSQIMHRLASSDNADLAWKRRCLDTREHVTFMAHEVDLAGRTVNVHDSSAGLSGGQRQKLVIFCLAAALRYQLAADEDELPSYATIILDEAFDKADSRYTRMAMDVFVEFGFHMILATPEKLLQTIEPYVGGITSITNASRRDSRAAAVIYRDDEKS